MNNTKQKLELTWIGKDREINLEPRILVEVPEKSYGDKNTENMLIHGDNLLALKALEQDYTGKIKCIYIDPPYNTGSRLDAEGNKIGYDDNIEHSTWLTLMKTRLELLHNLLRNDGLIFISIDDHEVAYLQVLMDEIFGRTNFVVNIPTVMNLKGNQDEFGFAGTHEYTLVYAKNYSIVKINTFPIDEESVMEDWQEDHIGYFKKGATLKSTGEESLREDRPKMFYPILFKENKIFSITINEYQQIYQEGKFDDEHLNKIIKKYEQQGYSVILPYKNINQYGRWRWGFESFYSKCDTEIIPVQTTNGISLYKKQRPELGDLPTQKPKSLFYKPEYSSGNGTAQIKNLFGYNAFPYPKPEDLIKDFIILATKEGDIVLECVVNKFLPK